MKRSKVLFLMLLTSFMSVTHAFAQGLGTLFEKDGIRYRVTQTPSGSPIKGLAEIIYIGGSGEVAVPAEVQHPQSLETFKVTATAIYMNPSPAAVTKITLPEGLTKINSGGFVQCKGLKELVIPATCTSIAEDCFTGSEELKKFTVSTSNTVYKNDGNNWLLNKAGNKLISLPKGWVGEVNIPTSITSMGPAAMFRCPKTTVVKIPATFTAIEETADNSVFGGSATKFEVAAGNTAFTDINGVLYNASGTDLIAFPVNHYAAATVAPGDKYTLPNTATTIHANAFYGTLIPKKVDLSNVTTLKDKAFSQAWGLVEIKLGAAVNNIGKGVFTGCARLAAIDVDALNSNYMDDNGVLYTKTGDTVIQFPPGKTGNYTILDGTKNVAPDAFRSTPATGSPTVTLPSSIEKIGLDAFRASNWANIVIPSDSHLKEIGPYAFESAKISGTLTLPKNLEKIGGSAFGKSNLTEVRFPDGVKLDEFPYDCFAQMPELKKVVFEGNAPNFTTIKQKAFDRCPKLETVDIPSKVTVIEASAFVTTPSLQTVNFKTPASLTTVGGSAFAKSGLHHIDLPSSVTTIKEFAFDNCTNLTNVKIPASVTTIERNPFAWCDKLENIDVDDSNTTYASLAGMLTNKAKTELVVFPAGRSSDKYTMIPNIAKVLPYAFYSSTKLNNITVPRTVGEIGERAIARCTGLKSISFMGEESVPTLNTNILYESTNPKDVTIFVRKRWYENPANTAKVTDYNTKFKIVHPSFVSQEGYDLGTEFFPTSMTDAGVISFFDPRTSVIIGETAFEKAYTDIYGKHWVDKTYNVSSVLDYAFEEEVEEEFVVKDIVFLGEIGVIGLNAFKTGPQLKGIYFVGNTPGTLNSVDYEHPGDYPFNPNQTIYVKQSKVATYKSAWEATAHTLKVEWKIPQTTNSYGATRCYPFDTQYNNDGDVRPYLPVDFSHMNAATPIAKARRVDNGYVPAYLGVLLHSVNAATATSYCQMTEAQDHHAVTDYSGGMYSSTGYKMVGVVEDTKVMSDASNNLYAFSKSQGKFLKIKKAPTGNTMPYFSAYLKLNSANQAKEFSFSFYDDDTFTTGIEGVSADERTNDNLPYYNLNGMRVDKPTKGVYIQNGKKLIIK